MDERRAKVIARLEQRHKKTDDVELDGETSGAGTAGRDATLVQFEDVFSSACDHVQRLFDEVERSTPQTNLQQQMSEKIADLNKLLTDYIAALPQYEVRKAQQTILDFTKQQRTLLDEQKPRKAFAFGRKKRTEIKPEKPPQNSQGIDVASNGAGDAQPKQFSFLNDVDAGQTVERADVNDETVQIDNADGHDVMLQRLVNCDVVVACAPSTVHISTVRGCRFMLRPVGTSVFVDNASDCTVVVACQQLRVHRSRQCHFYLHATGCAIIEASRDVRVAPYPENCNPEFFQCAGLDRSKENNWDGVRDFDWLADDVPSPNWSVLPETQRKTFNIQ